MKNSTALTRSVTLIVAAVVFAATVGRAQQAQPPALPDGPISFKTPDQAFRVVPVAKGLSFPWSLAFLPDGAMLVTERPGRLRIIRNGVLDPTPVAGSPTPFVLRLDGLMDIALHPRF